MVNQLRGKSVPRPNAEEPKLKAWFGFDPAMLRFGLIFGACMIVLYALLATTFVDRALYGYLELNAWVANGLLHLLGQPTRVSEVTIHSPHFAMAIRRGCDAVEPTWLVCAAILSFPAPFLHKVLGIITAIGLLQILNLVRIVTLFLIGIHLPSIFNTVHLELWPTLFIVAAIAIFIGWKDGSHRHQPHASI